jgi:hypothetical protein
MEGNISSLNRRIMLLEVWFGICIICSTVYLVWEEETISSLNRRIMVLEVWFGICLLYIWYRRRRPQQEEHALRFGLVSV